MNIEEIINKLGEEIKGKKNEEVIHQYESDLRKNFEKISNNEKFFNLPLKNIFSIISKVEFDFIEENDKMIETIQNIIKNVINKHFEEKETILILQNLNLTSISFSLEEIFSLLELIRNCPILVSFCHLYKEQNKEVDLDYEYELQQKEQEIDNLKQGIYHGFPPITVKPNDFEPNIFIACQKGKLTSVQ